MDPAKDTANANSKLCRIEHEVNARQRPSVDRMEAIAAIVDEWREGTGRTAPAPIARRRSRLADEGSFRPLR